MARGRIIPNRITELSKCEIFVFGSNLQGKHNGRAGRIAHRCFGAEWGVGSGPTGRCYAIPTTHGGIKAIKPYVDEFIEYAGSHPNNRFLVTRVGCGGAGFTDDEMAPLFKKALELPNVNFSIEWLSILTYDEFVDAVMFGILPEEKEIPTPEAIDEYDLRKLTEEYKYIIGAKVKSPRPNIRVRYILENNRFGYAEFGDYILTDGGDMYLFTRSKEFADAHNQDMVETLFDDECKNRGYFIRVLFAGVETPYIDCNGQKIFTGDVIDINDGNMQLALGTLGQNCDGHNAIYAFVLDNHSLVPSDCKKMKRIGTVFFQLDQSDTTTVAERCNYFQGCYPGGLSRDDALTMAKFTPNFDQEIWKYHVLEELGVEYHWNH